MCGRRRRRSSRPRWCRPSPRRCRGSFPSGSETSGSRRPFSPRSNKSSPITSPSHRRCNCSLRCRCAGNGRIIRISWSGRTSTCSNRLSRTLPLCFHLLFKLRSLIKRQFSDDPRSFMLGTNSFRPCMRPISNSISLFEMHRSSSCLIDNKIKHRIGRTIRSSF